VPTALGGAIVLRTAHASVTGHTVRLHGRPFFPVMLIDQCGPRAPQRAKALGVNLILNETCQGISPKRQLAQVTPASFAVLPIHGQGIEGTKLVGWTFPDEPDNNGWTPARLEQTFGFRAGTPDGLVSFLTLSGRFFRPLYGTTSVSPSVVHGFATLPDVAGFDLYPLNHCDANLADVADAQRQFVALADDRPTFQWIETGPIEPSYCGGFQMTPQQLGAETWLAIIGGARGVGFFTHTWTPKHNAFDVSPDLQLAIRRTAVAIRAVLPGLTGTTLMSSATNGVEVLARNGGNATYVFAVNTQSTTVSAQLSVPALKNGGAGLYGERRSVAVNGGTFTDTFPALGIHIYVQRH
jgi:hypothetical protein